MPAMHESVEKKIVEASDYITKLHWALTFVHGSGEKAKAPLYPGWPDLRPTPEVVAEVLRFSYDAGIGLNLGASGLVDIEGDSPEAEAILDRLCEGLASPCWVSRRSKHRLFLRNPEISYLKAGAIEFRTGRHQSILPPSVIAGVEYSWLVSPFEVLPLPLPERLLGFYNELKARPDTRIERESTGSHARWPFRDRKDHLLRHFDLKAKAMAAGLRFCGKAPDSNGNIPCFVPAQLRGGDEDRTASGVFNICSGVLRDFATGQNHLFFRLMAALTGQPWQDIAADFEAQADAVQGRPHSRRITIPSPHLGETDRVQLGVVRAQLEAYYDMQLNRPPQPKTIHIIKGPPGLGKTYTLCQKIAWHQKKATILTLENKLARTHEDLLRAGGAKAHRMPVLRETACPAPEQYEAMSRRGFKPSQSFPCRKCSVGTNHCAYLLGFADLDQADQLCAAAIYHTHEDFYASHGNEQRPIVVFDENCLDLILAAVSGTLAQWQSFGGMLKRHDETTPTVHAAAIQKLIAWLGQIAQDFAGEVDDAEEAGDAAKFKVFMLPKELRVPGFTKDGAMEDWLNRSAYRKENREVRNLYGAAVYLLREPGSYVLLERIRKNEHQIINVRFRQKHPLPQDKEVFILDATANEELIRAIAPDWEIKVWECPPIEQKGQVVQIMDYDISRNRIRKEVAAHTDDNPAWLVQVVDHILEAHGPARLISFKDITGTPAPEMDLLSRLKHKDKISGVNNFPCRGHTFNEKTLIVVGTPYKDQASIWELAMAIWGQQGLPKTKYTRRPRDNRYFVSRNMEYEDAHLRPLHDFIVSADLVQAIGRVRPLQNEATVFVVSNAVISDWQVQQFTASELFDMRLPLRQDAAKAFSHYASTATALLDSGKWISNTTVCKAIDMPVRTGQGYWKLLRQNLQAKVEEDEQGRLRKRLDPKHIGPEAEAIVMA